ncbi:MAG TPA: lysylphosphatidylglycerol synthase domain-containing protein [Gaiellaceae bacterium]|nr:lysylphosphatidylglycerol synthase domain-containing protein [Gaiellaceae bacterium]
MRAARRLLLAGAVLAGLLGVAVLVTKAAGYGALLDRLRGADPAWLAVAAVAEALSFIAYVVVLRAAARLEGGPQLGYRTSAHLVFAGLGAMRVAATGGAGAIALDYWALTKAGATRDGAASRVLALFTLVFGVFGAGAWLAALLLAIGVGGSLPLHLTAPWLLGVPVLAAVVAFFRAPGRELRLPGRAGRVVRRILVDAALGLSLVRHAMSRPRAHAGLLTATVLYWLGDAACLWAALRAFDVSVPAPALALAYATGYLFTLLPLPLAGVGTVDAAMILAVGAVGVPFSASFLGVLAFRTIAFWLPTPAGIAAFATLRGLERSLERAARASP